MKEAVRLVFIEQRSPIEPYQFHRLDLKPVGTMEFCLSQAASPYPSRMAFTSWEPAVRTQSGW